MLKNICALSSMILPGISNTQYSYHPEYIGSYLIIGGGIALIVFGTFLTYRIYSHTREERKATAIESVNRQIVTGIQKARSPITGPGVMPHTVHDSHPQSEVSTALLGHRNNDETAYLPRVGDETELMVQNDRKAGIELTADLDETQYLIKE